MGEAQRFLEWRHYSVCYCNCGYGILYIYQNLLNFTTQKVNLNFCKLFKNCLGGLAITGRKIECHENSLTVMHMFETTSVEELGMGWGR